MKIKFKNNKQKLFWIETSQLVIALILVLPSVIAHFLHLFASLSVQTMEVVTILSHPIYGLIMASIVQFVIGYKFYIYMYYEIFKWKKIGMNTLIGVSTLITYCWSFAYFFYEISIKGTHFASDFINGHNQEYGYFFDIGASIILFMLIGHYISNILKNKASKDIDAINGLLVEEAKLFNLKSQKTSIVFANNLKKDQFVLVAKNEKIPVDGVVYKGNSYVNEALLTGEAKPILKNKNAKLFAGTINLSEQLIVKATVNGDGTILNSIVNKINEIQQAKPKVQEIADVISKYFTPFILAIGLLAFILNFFLGYEIQRLINLDWSKNLLPFTKFNSPEFDPATNAMGAIYYGIAVIAIACPCALGIATPLAIVVGVGRSSKNGIIYNKYDIFEKIKKLHLIAFDKTGTLTLGELSVNKVYGDSKNYSIIRSLEENSHHPLAKTLANYLSSEKTIIHSLNKVKEIPGIGIKGYYQKAEHFICSYRYAIKQKYQLDKKLQKSLNNINLEQQNMNVVAYCKNKKILNIFLLEDQLNPNSKNIIRLLKKRRIKTVMITGDSKNNAKRVADELMIDEYYYDVNPLQKGEIIDQLKQKHQYVGYVGDGVNDLVALEKADFAISISLTNAAANQISDLSIIDGNIVNVYNALNITKLTRRNIIFNFAWVFAYNIVTIPLAFIGIIPTLLAVIIMAFSDIAIIANTLLFNFISKKMIKNNATSTSN